MLKQHASVVLTQDLPAASLEAGDVGVVVHVHGGGEAYEVEFLSLAGTTVTVETLGAHQVRAANRHDSPHVRSSKAA